MSDLDAELKALIIQTLELEDIDVKDIVSDEPLFGDDGGLGLDSIDALEIGLVLQEQYGIELDPEPYEVWWVHDKGFLQLQATF